MNFNIIQSFFEFTYFYLNYIIERNIFVGEVLIKIESN